MKSFGMGNTKNKEISKSTGVKAKQNYLRVMPRVKLCKATSQNLHFNINTTELIKMKQWNRTKL